MTCIAAFEDPLDTSDPAERVCSVVPEVSHAQSVTFATHHSQGKPHTLHPSFCLASIHKAECCNGGFQTVCKVLLSLAHQCNKQVHSSFASLLSDVGRRLGLPLPPAMPSASTGTASMGPYGPSAPFLPPPVPSADGPAAHPSAAMPDMPSDINMEEARYPCMLILFCVWSWYGKLSA